MMHSLLGRVLLPLFLVFAVTPLAAVAGMNLRVDSVSMSANPVNAGGETVYTTTVTNIGDAYTAAIVFIYLSPDAEVTKDDTWLTFKQSAVLAPGETTTVVQTVTLPARMATGEYFLAAMSTGWYEDIDPSDDIRVLDLSVIGADCQRDALEQNDSLGAAPPVPVNEILQLNHCDDPDDWVSFQAVAGVRYGIQSARVGYRADHLTLAVYAADGTPLAATPQSEFTSNPKLIWTAPDSGVYYVRSRPYGVFHDVGLGTEYSFVIADVLPDLIVPYSDTYPKQGIAGGVGSLYTSVANYGFTDSGAFDVGVHLSATPVVTRDDLRVGYRRVEGLAANRNNDIGDVFIAFPGDLPAGTYYLAAIVDDTNSIAEYEEDNNRSETTQITITGPSCTPDAYEDDDIREMARPITLNQQQTHNFCEDPYDWFYFDAVAGQTTYLRSLYPAAYPGGPATPTGNVEVYDQNGQKLAQDYGVLAWTAPQTGRYYALARGGLSARDYVFAMLDQQPDLAAVPYWAMNTGGVPLGGVIDDGTYAVRNFGFVDSPSSLLGFYFSADSTITPTDQLLHSVALPPIPPDGLVSRTFVRVPVPRTLVPGTYQFGTIADPGNSVVEFDETNNGIAIRDIQVYEPLCAPDAYDDDDLPGQARPLALNETQNRNFCEDGYDWASVDLQAGTTYAFETRGDVMNSARPVIYDTEGRNALAEAETAFNNANYGWSAITAPATGRYYVLVTNLDQYGYRTRWGEYMNYTLRMSSCTPDAFEQDDADRTAGKPIAVNSSQSRNHCEDGIDWAVLTLGAPGSYTVASGNLGSTADTVIEIHSATSTTPLAQNDNLSVNNKASSVTYSFGAAGTYYIKVLGRQRGAGAEYTLSVKPAKGRK